MIEIRIGNKNVKTDGTTLIVSEIKTDEKVFKEKYPALVERTKQIQKMEIPTKTLQQAKKENAEEITDVKRDREFSRKKDIMKIHKLLWDAFGTMTIKAHEAGKLIRYKYNMRISDDKKNTDTGNYYLRKLFKLRLSEVWSTGRPLKWKIKPDV